MRRLFFLVAILVSIEAIFKKQDGEYNWRKSVVGIYSSIRLSSKASSLLVTSREKVATIARISPNNGEIVWRSLLPKNKFILKEYYGTTNENIIAIVVEEDPEGKFVYILESFSKLNGFVFWELQLSVSSNLLEVDISSPGGNILVFHVGKELFRIFDFDSIVPPSIYSVILDEDITIASLPSSSVSNLSQNKVVIIALGHNSKNDLIASVLDIVSKKISFQSLSSAGSKNAPISVFYDSASSSVLRVNSVSDGTQLEFILQKAENREKNEVLFTSKVDFPNKVGLIAIEIYRNLDNHFIAVVHYSTSISDEDSVAVVVIHPEASVAKFEHLSGGQAFSVETNDDGKASSLVIASSSGRVKILSLTFPLVEVSTFDLPSSGEGHKNQRIRSLANDLSSSSVLVQYVDGLTELVAYFSVNKKRTGLSEGQSRVLWTRHEALSYINQIVLVNDVDESLLASASDIESDIKVVMPSFEQRLELQRKELEVLRVL